MRTENKLVWKAYKGKNDNTYWWAKSILRDSRGKAYIYKIVQILMGNAKWYSTEKSSKKLMKTKHKSRDLFDVKNICQVEENKIFPVLDEYSKHGTKLMPERCYKS